MSNPLETIWAWARTAPLPVVLALMLLLGGWVYQVEGRVAEQDNRLARMEATLEQVDTNVQTLLNAVLWEKETRKVKENR